MLLICSHCCLKSESTPFKHGTFPIRFFHFSKLLSQYQNRTSMSFLVRAVRKRLSLSTSSDSLRNSQDSALLSKSLDDLRLAPFEDNEGQDMVFYCKLLGSGAVKDKNGGPELTQFADDIIKSYSSEAGERKRVLSKNKTMIRVNTDGLQLSTDGYTEKSKLESRNFDDFTFFFTRR